MNFFSKLIAPYRKLGLSIWFMFFATMINRFGDFVSLFLSLYITDVLGYDKGTAGLLVTITFLISSVGALFSGRIADLFGRKRCLIIFQVLGSLLTLATGFLLNFAWAPFLLVGANFFRGCARPLIGAILTDLAPVDKRKAVFGLQYWSINVGVALGPYVAAKLFESNLPWLFFGDAITSFIAILFILFGVVMPKNAHIGNSKLESHDNRGALRAFLSRPVLVMFCFIGLLSSFTYSNTSFLVPLHTKELFGTQGLDLVAQAVSFNAVLVLVLSIPIARLLISLSPLKCMAISSIFYLFGFGMFALPLNMSQYLFATFIWTLGEICNSVNMGVFQAKYTPINYRGAFNSFTGVFYSVGFALGPWLLGSFATQTSIALTWALVSGISVVWGLMAFFLDLLDKKVA